MIIIVFNGTLWGSFLYISRNASGIRKPNGIIALHSSFKHLPRMSFCCEQTTELYIGDKIKRLEPSTLVGAEPCWKALRLCSEPLFCPEAVTWPCPLHSATKAGSLPCPEAIWEEVIFFFFFLINTFIYLFIFGCIGSSLRCARFSLVAASRGYYSLQCAGFSLRWLLLLWSTGSRFAGFSSCSTRTSVVVAHGL